MSRPALLVTRPEAEQTRTIAAVEAAGFEAVSAPLLLIHPVEWKPPAASPDALLFTSARAPALAAEGADLVRGLPAYAVGARTAAAARAAGFHLVGTGDADGTAIVARAAVQGHRRLLHLAGEATARIETPAGVHIDRIIVYSAQPVEGLPQEDRLRAGSIFAALAFSPRTACILGQRMDAAGIARGTIALVALSPAVEAAAGPGWRAIATASSPDLDAAMAAARRLWQDRRHG